MGNLLERLRGLGRNRLALAGAAGAAGLGALTLVRKRKAATKGAAGSDVADVGDASQGMTNGQAEAYTGAGSFPNTYQTDLSTALGDLDSRYADSLATYTAGLGSTDDALKAMQSQQAGSIATLGTQLAALTKAAAAKAPAKAKKPVKPPTPAQQAKTWSKTYKVKRGDTLGALAGKFGTTVGALAKHNNIKNPNSIATGATLKVPG